MAEASAARACAPSVASAERANAAMLSALLAYAIAMAVVATLAPFELGLDPSKGWDFRIQGFDVAQNLLLLLPAGALFRLRVGRDAGPSCVTALAFGMGVSLTLELLQFFVPARCASPIDVLANGLGAWLGALLVASFEARLAQSRALRLVRELPVAAALGFVLPLLVLDLLAAVVPARLLLAVPLAFVIAIFGARAWRSSDSELREHAAEARAMRRALPWYALYLVGLASYPWSGFALHGVVPGWGSLGHLELVRGQLEAVLAFTLLGYALRTLEAGTTSDLRLALRVTAPMLGSAACFELVYALASRDALHVERMLLLVASALTGALFYDLHARLRQGAFADAAARTEHEAEAPVGDIAPSAV